MNAVEPFSEHGLLVMNAFQDSHIGNEYAFITSAHLKFPQKA
ncbi:MAG: hypothetical protein R3E87_22235 [Burkholderiaceae bacterium]